MIAAADLAMYRAKHTHGDNICCYDPSMDEQRRARRALAVDLRDALEHEEFVLYYQPQLDTRTGEVSGFEALLRWRHPRRGMVSPVEFIPIPEETGLILPVGEWVLKRACAEAVAWEHPYRLAVNIAAAQLTQTNLAQTVHETLLQTGLAPDRLELEITVASLIEDMPGGLKVIRKLKALGVGIVMDDYGTGYSSLATLQQFPFDKIKIDRSFARDLSTNKVSQAIIKASVLLARSIGVSVLAEGVESEEHYDLLMKEGCSEVQGFLFGRPAPYSKLSSRGRKHAGIPRAAPTSPANVVSLKRG